MCEHASRKVPSSHYFSSCLTNTMPYILNLSVIIRENIYKSKHTVCARYTHKMSNIDLARVRYFVSFFLGHDEMMKEKKMKEN